MGAYAFLFQFCAAMAATVTVTDVLLHFLRKNPDEKQQEKVADIDVRRQDKEKVAEDAARHQSQHVENGSRRGELAEQGFEHRQSDNEEQPDAEQEQRKDERHFERRQGGVEVKMFPSVGHKHLHRFVHRSAERQQQTEEQRIYAVDIVEIDHAQLLFAKSAKQVNTDKQGENNDEIRGVRIAEQVDGLRNAVGRNERADEFFLAYPPLRLLRMRQLHPYTVHAVGGMHGKLRHHHAVSFVQADECVLDGQAFQVDGIADHLQIGVPGVMPFVQIPQRISRFFRKFARIQIGNPIPAARQKKQAAQQARYDATKDRAKAPRTRCKEAMPIRSRPCSDM